MPMLWGRDWTRQELESRVGDMRQVAGVRLVELDDGRERGARAGDVYVLVHVRPDPRFAREGNDIFSTVDLTMTQAALGASISIPTLDGEEELEFQPGTQPGQIVVLRGRGMPVLQGFGRGDHRVLVNVLVPHRVTEEQRRLLEEFERGVGDDTYKADESFFEKLKSAFR